MLSILAQAMPGMPPTSGWLAIAVLLLLGAAAFIDARTGRVPDFLILPGLFFIIGAEGFYAGWPYAGLHLAMALIAGFTVYTVNQIWYRFKKRDAIGMGDAKWSMPAIASFGAAPLLIAWFLGAWLALGWMGLMRLSKRRTDRIYFAPFLFIGLLAGIYWLHFR